MRFSALNDGEQRELRTEFDVANSFGGKAHVRRNGGRVTLESYGLPVAVLMIDGEHRGGIFRTSEAQPESNTTARHMREFIRQAGGEYQTMKQLRELPVL